MTLIEIAGRWHGLALAVVLAACEPSKSAPADTPALPDREPGQIAASAQDAAPVAVSADVGEYFEAKERYGKAGTLEGGWAHPTSELRDLDARLRAIVGPVIIDGHTMVTRITLGEAQYDGQESGQELDGQAFALAGAQAVVSTRRLLAGWLAGRRAVDSARSPLNALESDDALTWVFSGTAAAKQYVNLRHHSELPGGVFLAKLVVFAQDVGDWPPDRLIVGVARDERIYVVAARPRWVLSPPTECLPFDENTYYDCYDRIAANKPEYQQLVAQVKDIVALLPGK